MCLINNASSGLDSGNVVIVSSQPRLLSAFSENVQITSFNVLNAGLHVFVSERFASHSQEPASSFLSRDLHHWLC